MSINKNKLGGALLYIVAAIVLIVLMDLCIGGASAWLYHHSNYGIFHRQQYVMNESIDDIIILGSSRASHHYVPSVITDSLGMSCYNAGSEGMCIYYHYAMLSAMIERGHVPKIVIYDVMDLDAMEYPGPTFTLDAALDRLAPHYGDFKSVDSLFALKGWKEKLKMKSIAYRYNSKLVQSIKCNFMPMPEDNGYESVTGTLPESIQYEEMDYQDDQLDTEKIEYVKKLADIAKSNGMNIYFVLSPMYAGKYSSAFDAIKRIAEERGIPFIDCFKDSTMMQRPYFRDGMHLNDDGANIWTAYFAHILKTYKQ